MNIVTILGIVGGFACIVISILTTGNIIDFFDPGSIFVVIGGTLGATIASFSTDRLKRTIAAVKFAFHKSTVDLNADIENIITIANVARRDGLLALEEMTDDMKDPFLTKAIMLVVDGSDPELIQSVLETELAITKSRHADNRAVLEAMSAYSPAFGMVGTLIGLVNMLRNLADMDSLGANMSVALVTTFYGSILANLVFSPLAKRLKTVGSEEYLQKELVIEGVLSIQNGENPRVIREKLNSFLAREGQSDGKKKKEAEPAEAK